MAQPTIASSKQGQSLGNASLTHNCHSGSGPSCMRYQQTNHRVFLFLTKLSHFNERFRGIHKLTTAKEPFPRMLPMDRSAMSTLTGRPPRLTPG